MNNGYFGYAHPSLPQYLRMPIRVGRIGQMLNAAQQRVYDLIKTHGYAKSLYFTNHYYCAGQTIQYEMIQTLRAHGLLKGVPVQQNETVANMGHLPVYLVVPVDKPTGVQ